MDLSGLRGGQDHFHRVVRCQATILPCLSVALGGCHLERCALSIFSTKARAGEVLYMNAFSLYPSYKRVWLSDTPFETRSEGWGIHTRTRNWPPFTNKEAEAQRGKGLETQQSLAFTSLSGPLHPGALSPATDSRLQAAGLRLQEGRAYLPSDLPSSRLHASLRKSVFSWGSLSPWPGLRHNANRRTIGSVWGSPAGEGIDHV